MINCHRGTAKNILDKEYTCSGLAPGHTITKRPWLRSRKRLRRSIMCALPGALMVERPLLENGLAASKIISASYGWDPARIAMAPAGFSSRMIGPHHRLCGNDLRSQGLSISCWNIGRRATCVAVWCSLERWSRAIKEKYAALLARDDVVVHDFASDIGSTYRSADVLLSRRSRRGRRW